MRSILAIALLAMPMIAKAQPAAEVPSAVKAFAAVCLAGGIDPAARKAALSAAGWTRDVATTVDVPKLEISQAIERNFDFSNPETAEQWSSLIDAKPVRIVLATFPTKRRYPNICALVVDGVSNAMAYDDDLKAAFKAFGISRKSVDLVHYFEFAGKVGSDKHPVRGEVFSRSQASGAPNSMHIYVAY